LYIITHFALGGATETALYSAQGLRDKDWDVEIFHGQDEAMQTEGSLVTKAQELSVPLVSSQNLCRPIRPLQDLKAFWELCRYIKQTKPGVVHTHSSKAGMLGRLAAWLCRVPLIVHTVHGWSFNEFQRKPVRNLYQFLERLMARFSAYLVVVTKEDQKKGLAAKIGRQEQYRLIRSGIDLTRFRPPSGLDNTRLKEGLGLTNNWPVVLVVGRVSAQKDPFSWLEVAQLVLEHSPETYFVWAGAGDLLDEAKDLVRQHNFQDRIKFLGARTDVPNLLAIADIFLMTSLWEGLPRVLLQALAADLPVVATAVDGIKEVLVAGQNGLLCSPKDVRCLAHATLELLNNPKKRQQLTASHQHTLAEFTTEYMVERLDSLYQAEG
jgi:glycosyltransferase involved in cell wall biosynthesis